MKTGTEALSARILSEPLPESLVLPAGTAWPQSRGDVVKHPELELLGTRRGAPIERRLEAIVAEARERTVPEVTILLIAEALNVSKYPDYIVKRLRDVADSLTVVLFARHQVPALTSVVAHRVQSWTSPDHVALETAAVMKEAKNRFHYDRYLERWSGENHELIALPYFEDDRKTDGLMSRFSKFTGIPIPAATDREAKNASLGKAQLLELGAVKLKLARWRTVPLMKTIAEKSFFQLRKRLQSEKQSARWSLTASDKKAVIEFYRESNVNFKKMLGGAARRADWKQWFATLEARAKQ